MSDKFQEALVNFIAVLCGGLIASLSSILVAFFVDWRDRQKRNLEILRERRMHNISKIEDYLDSRISMIKSLTNPPVTTNTVIEYLKSDLSKLAGPSEAARASARLLGDMELVKQLEELEMAFLQAWDYQIQASQQQDLPELEKRAIDVYHNCTGRVEILKRIL